MDTPVKVVRILLPDGHVDHEDSSVNVTPDRADIMMENGDENNPGDINIVMKTRITSPSKQPSNSPQKPNRTGHVLHLHYFD